MILRCLALIAALAATSAQAGCGDAPEPCSIAGGTYHITLPDTARPDGPAVVFLHGWGGTGADMLRMTAMVAAIRGRGHALILPDGLPRDRGRGQSWAFHPDRPGPRDEAAFLRSVADDAATRFGLNRDRMLLAGFSIGGSMTSYVACNDPQAFAAYAPVAGAFWRPHPTGCAAPVQLFHTHGWTDRTVPLEGRQLGSGFAQGDVFASLEIWREALRCHSPDPDRSSADGPFWLRHWDRCAPGSSLHLALHGGGHSVPKGWADMALDWFSTLN